MTRTQANRWLLISTPLGDDVLLLTALSGTDSVSGLFQLDLELASERSDLRFEDVIGGNVTVRMDVGADEPRYFNGFVTRFVQTSTEAGLSTYRATVSPWLWFLTRSADCRIFQDMTVPDIVKQVFRDRGFSDFKDSLTSSYVKRDYCVQYRETDFNFISRLLEHEGISYFFMHESGKHVLVLADAIGAYKPYPGFATFIYRPPSQGAEELDRIRQWSLEKEVLPAGYTLADFDFKTPKKQLVSHSAFRREHAMARGDVFDYPGDYQVFDAGDTYARIRIEEWQAQYELAAAGGDVRGVAPGHTFRLTDHPRDDQNREYLIVSATYDAKAGGYGLGGGAGGGGVLGGGGGGFSCRFTAIPAVEQYRPARTTQKPRIQGPQTAIVVGKQGEEIWTDEHGRVKVKFHWDRDPEINEKSSCWIRVAQNWAGKKWGSIGIPRVGHEVVVDFLEGDPDRPLVTGRVYNGDNMPPYKLPEMGTISGTKSSSSKGGGGFNEIRFEDKKGEEQVFIHAEKNHDLRIKKDSFEWIGNNRHLIVKTDRFEDVENNHHEKVGADHKEQVGKDYHLKVGGKSAIEVGGSHSLTVKGNVIEVFKGNHSEQTSQNLYLKAMGVVIESSSGITLKCGPSAVVIDAAGVTMKGAMLTLDGQMVKIASGPGSPAAAGSAGAAVAPAAPDPAEEADLADPGDMSAIKARQRETHEGRYGATPAPPLKPAQSEEERRQRQSWIEIELVDKKGNPVPGEPYVLGLPDGTETTGVLNEKGFIRVDGITPGSCLVKFPRLDKDAWRPV